MSVTLQLASFLLCNIPLTLVFIANYTLICIAMRFIVAEIIAKVLSWIIPMLKFITVFFFFFFLYIYSVLLIYNFVLLPRCPKWIVVKRFIALVYCKIVNAMQSGCCFVRVWGPDCLFVFVYKEGCLFESGNGFEYLCLCKRMTVCVCVSGWLCVFVFV